MSIQWNLVSCSGTICSFRNICLFTHRRIVFYWPKDSQYLNFLIKPNIFWICRTFYIALTLQFGKFLLLFSKMTCNEWATQTKVWIFVFWIHKWTIERVSWYKWGFAVEGIQWLSARIINGMYGQAEQGSFEHLLVVKSWIYCTAC